MKKQCGIWLDFAEALIVHLNGKEVATQTIPSEIDRGHPKGGARSKTPWGPMDVMDEKKVLARTTQQAKAYYQQIIQAMGEVEEIYVFGPAEAKIGLQKALVEAHLKDKVKAIEVADSMTKNQKVAQVKAFFADN